MSSFHEDDATRSLEGHLNAHDWWQMTMNRDLEQDLSTGLTLSDWQESDQLFMVEGNSYVLSQSCDGSDLRKCSPEDAIAIVNNYLNYFQNHPLYLETSTHGKKRITCKEELLYLERVSENQEQFLQQGRSGIKGKNTFHQISPSEVTELVGEMLNPCHPTPLFTAVEGDVYLLLV